MSFKVNFKNIQPYGVQEEDLEKMYNQGYEIGNSQGYSNGYKDGEQVGIEQGIEQGEKQEHDRFWDSYQNNGRKEDYTFAFAGGSWNDKIFKPKYDIIPTQCREMFDWSSIRNLKEILTQQNVVLDVSKSTIASNCFYGSQITHLPILHFDKASNLSSLFAYSIIKSIDELSFREDAYISFLFNKCNSLEHCIFACNIVKTGLDMKDCVLLDKESIVSAINCLSTETSGQSVTLSLQSVDKAFETSENANNGSTSSEWLNLINTKSNWTITLA